MKRRHFILALILTLAAAGGLWLWRRPQATAVAPRPPLTLCLSVTGSAMQLRVPVDPDNPLPALRVIADTIQRECRLDSRATMQKPVALAFLKAEMQSATALPDTDVPGVGRLGNCAIQTTVGMEPMYLLQAGPARFGWTGNSTDYYPRHASLPTIVETTSWLGHYYAGIYTQYRAWSLTLTSSISKQPPDQHAAVQVEQALRASEEARGNALAEQLRRRAGATQRPPSPMSPPSSSAAPRSPARS